MQKPKLGFMLGLSRSGTTWISNWMHRHENVHVIYEEYISYKIHNIVRDHDIKDVAVKFLEDFFTRVSKGKEICIEKSPGLLWWGNVRAVDVVNSWFPECKHLLMVRDGKNWVHSVLNMTNTSMKFTIKSAVEYWRRHMEAMSIVKDYDNVLMLRYEDVLADVKSSSDRITKHFGLKGACGLEPWTTPVNTVFVDYDKDRWKKMCIIDELRPMNEYLEKFGYDPV